MQDELVDYNLYDLVNTDEFNKNMVDYLLWYSLKRPHYALGQISPIDYIRVNEGKYKKKCNMLWTHTSLNLWGYYTLLALNCLLNSLMKLFLSCFGKLLIPAAPLLPPPPNIEHNISAPLLLLYGALTPTK